LPVIIIMLAHHFACHKMVYVSRKFKFYNNKSMYPSIIWLVNITFLYSHLFVTILHKNPTNAIIHVNTTLFTVQHYFMFQCQ
jgi:purine-cytosine permease-like protein